MQADVAKNGTIPRSGVEGSNGTQASSWCSLEGSSTCNDGHVLNGERMEPSVVASAITDGCKQEQKEKIKAVIATAEQISRAPFGNSNHMIWKCQAHPMKEAREKWTMKEDRQKEGSCNVAGHPAWERGLVLKASPPRTAIAATESFRWIVRPQGDMFEGEIHIDGSALDGPTPELMRCGWAFVVISLETGEVVASAMGAPPPWITDIGGSEAWAMLQAAIRVMPGGRSRFKGDCKACIDLIHASLEVAASPKRALARVYNLLLQAMEDICLDCDVDAGP